MQAYNSIFNNDPNPPRLIGNFPILPLRTKTRGPAYTLPIPHPPLPASDSPDPDSESYDVLDEVISLFRANTFFRNFEIQGPADRLLIYGIWFLSDCLQKIKPHATARDAQKDVMNLALDSNFAIPGDPGFPLNQVCSIWDDESADDAREGVSPPHFHSRRLGGRVQGREADRCMLFTGINVLILPGTQMYEAPRDRQDAEQLRQYMAQVRQELASRLLARVYADDETKPSKWWLSFTKRKFMGKAL